MKLDKLSPPIYGKEGFGRNIRRKGIEEIEITDETLALLSFTKSAGNFITLNSEQGKVHIYSSFGKIIYTDSSSLVFSKEVKDEARKK